MSRWQRPAAMRRSPNPGDGQIGATRAWPGPRPRACLTAHPQPTKEASHERSAAGERRPRANRRPGSALALVGQSQDPTTTSGRRTAARDDRASSQRASAGPPVRRVPTGDGPARLALTRWTGPGPRSLRAPTPVPPISLRSSAEEHRASNPGAEVRLLSGALSQESASAIRLRRRLAGRIALALGLGHLTDRQRTAFDLFADLLQLFAALLVRSLTARLRHSPPTLPRRADGSLPQAKL